jgi:ABC-type multidrug transport system fused ATPase/permease subunit
MLAMNCDRIILMDAGKIIAEGTAETLFHNPHFKEIFRLNNFELPTLSNRPSGKSK